MYVIGGLQSSMYDLLIHGRVFTINVSNMNTQDLVQSVEIAQEFNEISERMGKYWESWRLMVELIDRACNKHDGLNFGLIGYF